MKLANGLYFYLPPDDYFTYPADDEICPEAIGWIKKGGDGLCCSSCEQTEINIGYIKKATGFNGAKLETGGWVITRIRNARFEKDNPGEVNLLKADIRGPGTSGIKKISNVMLHTAFLSITDLFQQ